MEKRKTGKDRECSQIENINSPRPSYLEIDLGLPFKVADITITDDGLSTVTPTLSGADAALSLAYELAAGQTADGLQLLQLAIAFQVAHGILVMAQR